MDEKPRRRPALPAAPTGRRVGPGVLRLREALCRDLLAVPGTRCAGTVPVPVPAR